MAELKILGLLNETFESQGRVYDKNGLAPTIRTFQGGGLEPKIIEDFYQSREPRVYEEVAPTIRAEREGLKVIEKNEKKIVAMRGRNPEHPTDRTAGIHTEQRLEPAPKGVVNTLTTVQKDNLVLETKIKRIGQISSQGSQCGTVVSDLDLSPTLSAGTHGYANSHVATNYRIRKLTPRECYRLMGFSDEDFDRASGVISNTQLYKTAGNSIIKQVLMAIFSQMNIKGVKPWNEVHDAE